MTRDGARGLSSIRKERSMRVCGRMINVMGREYCGVLIMLGI